MSDLMEGAVEAVSAMYNDMEGSQAVVKGRLEELQGYIQDLINALGE